MKRRVILGIVIVSMMLGVMACTKNTVSPEINEIKGTEDNENSTYVIGNVIEVSGDSYIVRLMGTGQGGVDAFLVAENRSEVLNKGDEVLIQLNGELCVVKNNDDVLQPDMANQFSDYATSDDRFLYTANIDEIKVFENDGVFEGKLGGIYDQYDEDFEKIIRTIFQIEPNDNEPEMGFFKVDTYMVPDFKSIGCRVTVTYDKETLEVLSVE